MGTCEWLVRAMAFDAEDYEHLERLAGTAAPVHAPAGRRVRGAQPAPAQAWPEVESDSRASSPGEHRRLLAPRAPPKPMCRLQAGLTLGVWGAPRKLARERCPLPAKTDLPKVETKYQKRKAKLLATLRPPYFILSMLIIMVCVHQWRSQLRAWLEWAPGAWWREPWRLLSYGAVHASHAHLALNALVALAVGWPLEREQGAWRAAALWGAGVAGGALGAGALQPRVRVVGASAAVYALLTAHLPNVCLRFGNIPLWWFRPLSVLVLGASEGCWALLHAPPAGARAGGVAWAAHACGAAVGVPAAFLVFTGENKDRRYIVVARIVSAVALAAAVTLAAVHYTFWHDNEHHSVPVVRELPS